MPKMSINRSVEINAPVHKVFSTLNDFNTWTAWSPWLIMDPEAKVNVRDDAKYYDWEGDRVGSGQMEIVGEKENETVDYDLLFLKPWKSKAKVSFHTKPKGDATEVSWTMDSNLPFFMFWMKPMMEAFVGMDYERGLNMLKDYVEQGKVPSKLDFKGQKSFEGCKYIGVSSDCSKETIGDQMASDFEKIWSYMGQHESNVAGHAFSIYSKWDMVKNRISYTSGVPVKEIPNDLPGGFVTGEIPATKVYELHHTGPYNHVGNAWTTLHNMARGKAFKMNKKINPWEFYLNDPTTTPQEQLETSVYFPVKS